MEEQEACMVTKMTGTLLLLTILQREIQSGEGGKSEEERGKKTVKWMEKWGNQALNTNEKCHMGVKTMRRK